MLDQDFSTFFNFKKKSKKKKKKKSKKKIEKKKSKKSKKLKNPDPTFCTQKSTKCWIQYFVLICVQNVGSNILYTKKYKMLDHQFFAQFRLDITKSTILRKNPDPTFCTPC